MDEQEAVAAQAAEVFRQRIERVGTTAGQAAVDISSTLGTPTFHLRGYRLGARGALAEAAVSCHPGAEPLTVWLFTFEQVGGKWREVAHDKVSGPGVPVVLSAGVQSPRFALLRVSSGMAHTVGEVEIRNLDLDVEQRVSERWDPEYVRRDGVVTLRWSRRPRHLDVEVGGPGMVLEDVTLGLDDGDVVKAVSRSPWINAVEAACDLSGNEIFCQGAIDDDRVTDVGHELVIETDGALPCDVVAAPPRLRMAAESRIVVTVARRARDWEIIQVRPANRECAVYGERIGNALGPVLASIRVPLPGRPRSIAAGADKLIVGTNEGIVILKAGVATTVAKCHEPRDVALLADGTPAWIDGDGSIALLRAGKVIVLTVDADAAGIASCATNVCWTSYDAGEVRQWEDGAIKVVAAGLNQPLGVVSDGENLFVATADGIIAMRFSDERRTRVAVGIDPVDVAVHRATIAWVEANGRVVLQAGSLDAALGDSAAMAGGRPVSIALTSDALFWIDAGLGELRRVAYRKPGTP